MAHHITSMTSAMDLRYNQHATCVLSSRLTTTSEKPSPGFKNRIRKEISAHM